MAALIFDSGGLIALGRGDRRVAALFRQTRPGGPRVVTSSACVAQVWRNPARQARLTRALAAFIEYPLDPLRARGVGQLLAGSGTSDVVDAAVVALAHDGDALVTSDPVDLGRLVAVAGVDVRLISV